MAVASSLADMKLAYSSLTALEKIRPEVEEQIAAAEAAAVVDVASLNALQVRLADINDTIGEQKRILLNLAENYSQLGKVSSIQNLKDLSLFFRLAFLLPERDFYIASGIRNNARRGGNNARRARRADVQKFFEMLYGWQLEQQYKAFPWSCCFVLRGRTIRVASVLERKQCKFNRRQSRIKEEEAKEGEAAPGDAVDAQAAAGDPDDVSEQAL